MKKKKIIIICIIIATLILIIPFPQMLKDGGTIYLRPLIPTYEIYILNAEWLDGQTMRGLAINLFGIEIYENTYFITEQYSA